MTKKADMVIGDLVQLKSGSPVMTVERLEPETDDEPDVAMTHCACAWFSAAEHGAEVRRDSFHVDMLKRSNP